MEGLNKRESARFSLKLKGLSIDHPVVSFSASSNPGMVNLLNAVQLYLCTFATDL